MATYFHGGGSELQAASADGTTTMQTLYLMNPTSAPYVPFSDTPNMFFLNPAAGANPHALSAAAFTHSPITTAAMLPPPPPTSEDPGRCSNYLWGFAMEPTGGGAHHHQTPPWQLGLRPMSPRRRGLSLSLLDDNNSNNNHHNNDNTSNSQMGEQLMMMQASPSSASASVVSNSMLVVRSKYLRAAQEVLEEVVSVGKGVLKSGDVSTHEEEGTKNKIIKKAVGDHDHQSFITNNDKRTTAAELTTAQRQDLHMKKAKLLNMLDEVEQRYKQYHQQMQMVVSAFEQAAGMGSARSYTAVALQTISRQFRCLKDAIEGQIKATSKSLGEEECTGAKAEGSRLRFVDQQLRQQRALQHLGMMHQNAWRPQRGLPERAVSVLRAWLFEHFLHPYPKDSDKALLAKQTGLTRSQVSNWFINARVRLWKPMVEEMYMEEMKEQEKNGAENSNKPINPNPNPTQITQKSQQNTRKPEPENPGINPTKMMNSSHLEFSSNSTISTSAMTHQNFNLIGSPDPDRILQPSPKKPRGADMQGSLDSILLSPSTTAHSASYGGYTAGFHGNGSVSLTLGLPHCDNLSQLSGNHHHHQQSFLTSGHHNIQLGRRLELGPSDSDFCGISSSPASHSAAATAYENMELQNRTKEFAAQLLPDFVA